MQYSYKNNIIRNFRNEKLLINIILSIICIYGVLNLKFDKRNFVGTFSALVIFRFLLQLAILYYFSVIIHELGHFITIKMMGLKLKLFVAGPLIYIVNQRESRVKIRRFGTLIMGGCVLPQINNILFDKLELDSLNNKYIKILYGGIFATFLMVLISMISIILKVGILNSLSVLIINWAILINVFNIDNNVYGDFVLINLLKKRSEMIIFVLLNNYCAEYPLNKFLVEQAEEVATKFLSKSKFNELSLALIDRIVNISIIKHEKLNSEFLEYKYWIFNNYFDSEGMNFNLNLQMIKLGYKFLLHEYSLNKEKTQKENYLKFKRYIMKNNYCERSVYFQKLIYSIEGMYERNEKFDIKYKGLICDLDDLLDKCENYNNMIKGIIKRLC